MWTRGSECLRCCTSVPDPHGAAFVKGAIYERPDAGEHLSLLQDGVDGDGVFFGHGESSIPASAMAWEGGGMGAHWSYLEQSR